MSIDLAILLIVALAVAAITPALSYRRRRTRVGPLASTGGAAARPSLEHKPEPKREMFFVALRRWENGDLQDAEHLFQHLASAPADAFLRHAALQSLGLMRRAQADPSITDVVRYTLRRVHALATNLRIEYALSEIEVALREIEGRARRTDRPLPEDATGMWELSRRQHGTGDKTIVPADLSMDNVHFTLTGPSVLSRGVACEIQFWIHVENQRLTVIQRAQQSQRLDESDLMVKSEGPFPLPRGARISVRFKVAGLECPQDHKWITWTGEIGNATFVVEVPADAADGTRQGTVSIRLNGCQIARMSFVLHIGSARIGMSVLPTHISTHRTAFASYASEDRRDVLARVQGMEAAYRGLKVFVDVVDLRSSRYWEAELRKRIPESDVFYLFWCRHANQSEWVEKEWRCALDARGLDFIDPVPLEGPEHAPPPKELAAKHFNDPLLAFIAMANGPHSIA